MDEIRSLIRSRSLKIAVTGLGYVGLPLAINAAQAGFDVTGIDIEPSKVAGLKNGVSHVQDVPDMAVQKMIGAGRFSPTTDYAAIGKADAIIICVPTPLRKTKDPDLSFITAAALEIEKYIKPGCLIILESTTYPGTTDELFGPIMARRGLRIGRDVFIAFSPERVDPGNEKFMTHNTPKVIGGMTAACGELAAELYQCFIDRVVVVSSARVAEMAKLLENTFRAVNIALVNEMAMMCDRMGIDVWEVIKAAATKPFGFMPFYPGPGIGGHCIPLDPQYLSWKAKTYDFYNRFIELASDINGNMPRYVMYRIAEALNSYGKCLSRSKILVLGVSYKKDVEDVRESPALEIIHLLKIADAKVDFNDPYVHEIITPEGSQTSVDLSNIEEYDCIVVATDHSDYNFEAICAKAALIVDTRNATAKHTSKNIIRLGDGWQPGFIGLHPSSFSIAKK